MARELYSLNMRKAVRNLIAYFDEATPGQIAEGARWYGDARTQAADMASLYGYPLDVCAAVISHLSPRTRWVDNVDYAFTMLESGERPKGCMQANYDRARGAIVAHYAGNDAMATFGAKAHKTRRFAQAIVDGGGNSVVIDVWMLRAIMQGPDYVFRDGKGPSLDLILKRAGVYGQCERAVQIAARRRGVAPAEFQAIVWLVISQREGSNA